MPKIAAIPDQFTAGYLDRLDGRSKVAVDMRARWQAMTGDLGGADQLSYAQRSLVERALWLEHWLHIQEQALADGDHASFDAGRWTQGCNALQGILVKLGLERRQKDVTDLQSYIRGRAANA